MPAIAETDLERGRAEGWLEAERHILVRLSERRFGPLPPPLDILHAMMQLSPNLTMLIPSC